MALGPINYQMQVATPFESVLQGMSAGAKMADIEMARAAQAAKITAQQQAMEQQQALDRAVGDLLAKPNRTSADFERVALMLPKDRADVLLKVFESRSKQAQQADLNFAGELLSASKFGDKNVVLSMLRRRVEAARNSGQEEEAKGWADSLRVAELTDPEQIQLFTGTMLARLPGGKDVIDAVNKVNPQSWERVPADELKGWGWSPTAQIVRNKSTGELKGVGAGGTNINLTSEGPIPPGFQARRDDQGRITELTPIPGSPAAQEQTRRTEAEAARTAGREQFGEIVRQDIDALLNKLTEEDKLSGTDKFNPFTRVTGVPGKAGEKLPGSARVSAQSFVDSIRANIGFDRLDRMRQESPTGGALGNITNEELKQLQSSLGAINLDADPKDIRRNLLRLRDIYTKVIRKAEAYPNAQQYGFGAVPPRPAGAVRPVGE